MLNYRRSLGKLTEEIQMKQQIIAVVGPDMCGKTEISKALSKSMNLPYFKASSEHETYLKHPDRFIHQLRYADTRMVDFLKQTGASVVFDRAWPCEYAYSKVFDRQTDLTVLERIDREMASLGTRIIVCHRTSYKGIVDDIDPNIKEDRLVTLDQAYIEFTTFTRCSTLVLNVDDENLKRELSDISTWLSI